MSEFSATVCWHRGDQLFTDKCYSRRHEWHFDSGGVVPGPSSPHAVRVPLTDPAAVDPEEAFLASMSSCHVLGFLDVAARPGWVVDNYCDEALDVMAHNAEGKLAMKLVTLRPAVKFGGAQQPDADQLTALHLQAHAECFMANSVKSEVRCEPVVGAASRVVKPPCLQLADLRRGLQQSLVMARPHLNCAEG